MSKRHYGMVVKKARKRQRMTQARLAALWPKDNGTIGVSVGFVRLVEAGKKRIESERTKRGLCDILAIEPWRFGLADYDPENPSWVPQHRRLLDQTLDMAEYTIRRFEDSYRTAPLPRAAADARQVHILFEYITLHQPLSIQDEKRFLQLYAQSLSLDGLIFIGYERYDAALQTFRLMQQVAEQLGEPAWIAHALLAIGIELHRTGYLLRQAGHPSDWPIYFQQAIQHLEKARDVTFHTSKNVAAYVHAYLARAYGSVGDTYHFEQAIDTARTLAPITYGDGTDFVYHRISGILAEQSYGFLDLGQPAKTLALRPEIERRIQEDENTRLGTWIHLDWARAYAMQGQVEESVSEGYALLDKARVMQSPHLLTRLRRFATRLREDYQGARAAQAFYEDVWSSGEGP
jgi:tetratricopeptide (TPR) repeat protein